MSRFPIHPSTDLIVYGWQFKILSSHTTPDNTIIFVVSYPTEMVDEEIVELVHRFLSHYQILEFIDDACKEYEVKPDHFLWVIGGLGEHQHVSQVVGNNVMARVSMHALFHSDFVYSLIVHELLHLKNDLASTPTTNESELTYMSRQLLLDSRVNRLLPDRFAKSLFAYDIFSLLPEAKVLDLVGKKFKIVYAGPVQMDGLLSIALTHPKIDKARDCIMQLKKLYRHQRSCIEAAKKVVNRFVSHPEQYEESMSELQNFLSQLRTNAAMKMEFICRGASFSCGWQILPAKSLSALSRNELALVHFA